jgi:hypothetical protein
MLACKNQGKCLNSNSHHENTKIMSCNNCEQVDSNLPTVAQDHAVHNNTTPTPCCSPEADEACASSGCTVPSYLTDAGCYSEDVTLLGRYGTKLARLAGDGFIKITGGLASVVPSVPFKIRDLWHSWWKPSNSVTPILGEPLPFPYLVVGDAQGNGHGIKGVSTEPSSPVFASNTFTMQPLSEQSKCIKGQMAQVAALELVGFVPLGVGQPLTTVRCPQGFSGEGILVVSRVATVPGNACNDEFTSVATLIAKPVGAGPYTFKYNSVDGYYWNADA